MAQRSRIQLSKEQYSLLKRFLFVASTCPIRDSKEPHSWLREALFNSQKSTTYYSQDSHSSLKRALFTTRQIPIRRSTCPIRDSKEPKEPPYSSSKRWNRAAVIFQSRIQLFEEHHSLLKRFVTVAQTSPYLLSKRCEEPHLSLRAIFVIH